MKTGPQQPDCKDKRRPPVMAPGLCREVGSSRLPFLLVFVSFRSLLVIHRVFFAHHPLGKFPLTKAGGRGPRLEFSVSRNMRLKVFFSATKSITLRTCFLSGSYLVPFYSNNNLFILLNKQELVIKAEKPTKPFPRHPARSLQAPRRG